MMEKKIKSHSKETEISIYHRIGHVVMRAQVFTMMAEKREHAGTRLVEEYDFVNEMVAAYEGQQTCPLGGPVRVLGDQSSCTGVGAQRRSSQVDASALGYRYTLVHSLAQYDA